MIYEEKKPAPFVNQTEGEKTKEGTGEEKPETEKKPETSK